MAPQCLTRIGTRLRARVSRGTTGESGFILLESVIAIALITVIMGAVGAEYVSSLAATNHARLQSLAAQVADSTLEQTRGLVPGSKVAGSDPSTLLVNRTKPLVDAEYSTLSAMSNVAPSLRPMNVAAGASYNPTDYRAFAANATNTGAQTVPTSPTPTNVGKVAFAVWQYLQCARPASPANSGSCVSASATSNYIQAFVIVTWSQRGCPNSTCAYVTSTLINDDADPTFDLKQPAPALPSPLLPAFATTKNSTCKSGSTVYQVPVSINDQVSVPLNVTNSGGVPPFAWTADQLPTGVTVSGQNIVGTVGGSATAGAPICTTLTVRDAFDSTATPRLGTTYLEWTVSPALTVTPTTDRSNKIGDSVNVSLAAANGSGNYSYTASGLPAGLGVTGSTISGAPTKPASVPTTSSVQLSATDAAACLACVNGVHAPAKTNFTWTVSYGPLVVTNPGTQTATNNTTLSTAKQVTMGATGGDGNYAWSATGLPNGLGINATTGRITGTPGVASVPSTSAVTVTVTDPGTGLTAATATFNWAVVAGPSISTPSAQTTSRGGTASLPMSNVSCPDPACSYTMSGQPAGLTINASNGVISGTVSTSATTSTNVTVTVTDSAGATFTTNPFTWTIVNAPTIDALGAQAYTETATHNVGLAYTCPASSCTISIANSIPGLALTLNAGGPNPTASKNVSTARGTIYISGTVSTSAVTGSMTSQPYYPVVTILASDGATADSGQTTWVAYAPPTVASPGLQVNAVGSAPSMTFANTCANGGCTFLLQNGPPGLSVDGTGKITGTTSGGSGVYTPTIQVTDADQISATANFTWAVTTTFAAASNNVGITKSSNRISGAFDRPFANADNAHHSYSYESSTATGSSSTLVAGRQFVVNSNTYLWPSTAGTGSADNVAAQGQVIAYSGSGSSNVGFLIASHNGNASGTVSIAYTDGSTTAATLSAADWVNSTSTYAVKSVQNNGVSGGSGSTGSSNIYIYDQKVSVNPAKQIAYIVLPTTTSNPVLHVFGISQPPLAAAFNNTGIATATTRGASSLDGNNYSLDYEAIVANGGPAAGATVSAGDLTYQWPAAAGTGQVDNVAAAGQVVNFTASGSNTLGFLVTGVNGSVSSAGGTVTYTSGNPTSFAISTTDWCNSGGSASAFTASPRYSQNGTSACTTSVNYAQVTVDATRTIRSITLPSNANLRVFAIGYGS